MQFCYIKEYYYSYAWLLLNLFDIYSRLVKVFPCLAVFMSSFTIMAIAVDRHRMICRPTYRQVSSVPSDCIEQLPPQIGFGWALLLCLGIFLTALLFCLPLYFKTRLHSLTRILVSSLSVGYRL